MFENCARVSDGVWVQSLSRDSIECFDLYFKKDFFWFLKQRDLFWDWKTKLIIFQQN